MTTKQLKVLKEMWIYGEKMGIKDIENSTGLKASQVYWAIEGLKQRKLIVCVEREKLKAGYGKPPCGRVYYKINENVIDRIKRLIKQDQDGVQ